MVLQQEAMLPVWGWADPGEKVTVSFGNVRANAIAGGDGKWRVDLPALRANTPPGNLVVAGKNTLTLSDVLVGDVWICSGQSNMEFGLGGAIGGRDEIARATDGNIRLFKVAHRDGIAPCDDVVGTWKVCSPQQVGDFSAVAYFFGKNLRASVGRPIGLIETAWSGSTAQAWTDKDSLLAGQSNPALKRYMDGYQKAVDAYPGGQAQLDAQVAEERVWRDRAGAEYNEAVKTWKAAVDQAKARGQEPPPKPAAPPQGKWSPANPRTPTMLYNGMLAPLAPFAVKGVAWYQGEDNTGIPMAFEYRALLPTLIASWRAAFLQKDLPFLIVQLPNIAPTSQNPGEPSPWAVLRESQLRTLTQPNTGLTVTIDLGDGNLHPPGKAHVGARLALVARHVAYGEDLVFSGPIYGSMKVEGNAIRIAFRPDSVGSGLVIGTSPRALSAAAGDHLQGFVIAGNDRKWTVADAKIVGNEIVVSSPLVHLPVAVRYGWAQNPTCTLYNKEGLPASPFRTDDWPPFQ